MTHKFVLGYADESCMEVTKKEARKIITKIGEQIGFEVLKINFRNIDQYTVLESSTFAIFIEIETNKDVHNICEDLLWHKSKFNTVFLNGLHEYRILE